MFYKKSDIEILCETLLALTERQEHFIEKFGIELKSPYHDAIHTIMLEVEGRFELPSAEKKNIKAVEEKKAKVEVKPKRRYFRRAPLKVIHGHSDDPENRTRTEKIIEREKLNEELFISNGKAVMSDNLKEPVIGIEGLQGEGKITQPTTPLKVITDREVTTENIDQLANEITQNFEPQEIEPQVS